jgi:uncharacterized protein (DUF1501 family)
MIDRRAFLKAGGLGVVTLGSASGGPLFLARAALATPNPGPFERRKVLVTIFQRGAMDGLMAVTPLDEEKALRKYRPRLAMSASRNAGDERLVDLGNGFGLHPALAQLEPFWREGRLGIVHQVGSPDPTRSHFDAQDYMETGTPGRKGTAAGWLNRVSGQLGHEASPFRAVSMTAALPRSLYGDEPAVAVSRLEDFKVRLPGAGGASQVAGRGFEALYEQTSQELLRNTGSDTFEALDLLEGLDVRGYRPAPGVQYPSTQLAASLRQVAQLIKADVGLEIAFAETGGWDTHVRQGTVGGSFARRADELAGAVAAFWRDLGPRQDDVLLATTTEFGRTVKENGSGGTDHGHGSCLFVLGNQVAGGRVHGSFEGLDRELLFEGRDLPVTTDFRAVFSELVASHLGATDIEAVFPGWQGARLPLIERV